MIRLQAMPGKEPEVEALLSVALLVAQGEDATSFWSALRFNSSTFGIFSTFATEDRLEHHLSGLVGTILATRTSELFAHPPLVEKARVLEVTP